MVSKYFRLLLNDYIKWEQWSVGKSMAEIEASEWYAKYRASRNRLNDYVTELEAKQ